MPVTEFIHPVSRERVPLDFFDRDTSGFKGRASWSPWAAKFVRTLIETDIRHAGIDLTATRCLGCPRQVFIESMFDYAVDPRKRYVMDRGTMMHGVAAGSWPSSYIAEHGAGKGFMTIEGELFGTKVSQLMDAVNQPDAAITEIIDLKFPNDWSTKWRAKGPFKDDRQQYIDAVGSCSNNWPKLDYAAQLNIARLLLAQQGWAKKFGYNKDTVLLTIWDHATNGTNELPIAQEVPHIAEDKLAQIKPGGGEWTVQEIVNVNVAVQEDWNAREATERAKDETKEHVASQIPLVGQQMFNGKKCIQYCDVEPICSRIAREKGLPTWER